MAAFTSVSGVAAPLPQANLDTDVIMPKQFLKGITRDDLARGAFFDLRFDAEGAERTEFVLNQPAYRQSCFLVVGLNFGCGSSREHAVWGLSQLGIRAIIGSSFGSIFQDNCYRNGLLPICLSPQEVQRLLVLCADADRARLRVDLLEQVVELYDGSRIEFSIDGLRREDLLNGRDAVVSTLQFAAEIDAFEYRHWRRYPWLTPKMAVE